MLFALLAVTAQFVLAGYPARLCVAFLAPCVCQFFAFCWQLWQYL